MMLGNRADCDGWRGDDVDAWDGSGGLPGVALIDVIRWVGFEIVAPTGGGIWNRTEVA